MNTKTEESSLILHDGYRTRSDAPAVPAVSSSAVTPMDMLKMAVSQGADLAKLEQLMALQERYEANEARKAFYKALSAFKAEGITVGKDSRVTYKTDKGVTDYKHASLGNICNIIGPALSRYGLSYRWDTVQVDARIKITCVLSHELGHSEKVSLEGGADASGGKNNIQAVGSTVSYLERYTLLAITGTATEQQEDDDGQSSESGEGAGGKMAERMLADYLAAIEAATTKKDIQKAYMPALIAASEAGDQGAQNRLNAAKNAAIVKVKE